MEHFAALEEVFNRVRAIQAEERGLASVEQAVAILLQQVDWTVLVLDCPFHENDFDERVVDLIVSRSDIEQLSIEETIDASSLLRFLERTLPIMASSLERIYFLGIPTTAQEAERMFSLIRRLVDPSHMGFTMRQDYSEGVLNAFKRHILESPSLICVQFWTRVTDEEEENESRETFTGAQFRSICETVGASSTLQTLGLPNVPVEESEIDHAAESIAQVVVNSPSLKNLTVAEDHAKGWTMKCIERALLQTTAVKRWDVTFHSVVEGILQEANRSIPVVTLTLSRSNPWMPLLGDDNIPLNYWPKILAKANGWKEEDSHSSLDALYLLLSEKNDVLLQNVRKRRIRKRKRYSA